MMPPPVIVRSTPSVVPPGRSYVADPPLEDGGGILTFPMQDFDYTGLFTTMMMKERDFVLLEWDIAIERNGLDKFLKKIERKREVIHAVPYQVLSGDQLVWVPTNEDWSWVNYGVKTSAHFGFGCTYFPLSRIRHWKPNPIDPRLTDTNFSNWHFNHFGPVQLHWDIKVVHLNV